MITYERQESKGKISHKVRLDKKHIGDVLQVEGGWQYKVKNSRIRGAVLATEREVFRSLEMPEDD